eukprot:3985744-Pyramimonas_sp.AAC.1
MDPARHQVGVFSLREGCEGHCKALRCNALPRIAWRCLASPGVAGATIGSSSSSSSSSGSSSGSRSRRRSSSSSSSSSS